MYHHFGSKAGLYEAIVKAQNGDLIDQITAALSTDPAAPRLRAGITPTSHSWRLVPPSGDVSFAIRTSTPTSWMHRRLQCERAELLASLLNPPDEKGRAARTGKQLFSELLTTAIRAYAAWWYDHPNVPRRRVVDTVMDSRKPAPRASCAEPRRDTSR
jgi:AcrR family transcriptional regulator